MATIKLQGNASGSGNVTLTAPNTNSTRTITLPDRDLDFGSLDAEGGVKAWATFTMDGTARILEDAGVSSLTDLATGKPQFNLSTALSAANGLPFNTGALWSDAGGPTAGTNRQYAIQTGGRISVTTSWLCFCGSEGSGYMDWDLGYSGCIR